MVNAPVLFFEKVTPRQPPKSCASWRPCQRKVTLFRKETSSGSWPPGSSLHEVKLRTQAGLEGKEGEYTSPKHRRLFLIFIAIYSGTCRKSSQDGDSLLRRAMTAKAWGVRTASRLQWRINPREGEAGGRQTPWLREKGLPASPQTLKPHAVTSFHSGARGTRPPLLRCLVEVGTKYALTIFLSGKSTCRHDMIKRKKTPFVRRQGQDTLSTFQYLMTQSSNANVGHPLLALQVWLPLGQDTELRYAVFNIIYSFKKVISTKLHTLYVI